MKNHSVFDVFRRLSRKLGILTCKDHGVLDVFGHTLVQNHGVFEFFYKLFFRGCPKSAKDRFWRALGALWEPFGESFWACWSVCGTSWASFGSKMEPETSRWGPQKRSWLKKRWPKGFHRHSMGRFWKDVPHLLCVVLYFDTFSCKKV